MSVNWAELGLKALATIVILVVTAILAMVVKGAVAKLAQRILALQKPGVDGAGLGASIGAMIVWLLGTAQSGIDRATGEATAAQHPACAEAAMQTLGIASISEPASAMLTAVFTAIPNIVAAVVLVVLGVLIARFVSGLFRPLLESSGIDTWLTRQEILPEGSSVVPAVLRVVEIAVVLFFAVMSAMVLGFPQVTAFLSEILALGGNVLFGGAVIILFTTMGLQSMGVADSIIEMAFGALVIGAAAAAVLAFGLGGRDAAARQLAKPESAKEAKPAPGPGPQTPVDVVHDTVKAADFDALVLPVGTLNVHSLRGDETAQFLTRAFAADGKPVAATCQAPWLLVQTGLADSRELTSVPTIRIDRVDAGGRWADQEVVADDSGGLRLIPRTPDDLEAINAAIIDALTVDPRGGPHDTAAEPRRGARARPTGRHWRGRPRCPGGRGRGEHRRRPGDRSGRSRRTGLAQRRRVRLR